MPTSSSRSKILQETLRDRFPRGLLPAHALADGSMPPAASHELNGLGPTHLGSTESGAMELQAVDWELESLVERFEVAMAADASIDVGHFFPPPSHPRYAEIACELLRVDMEIQSAAGRAVSAEDYRRRFPGALADQRWFDVLVEEQQRVLGELLPDQPMGSLLPLTAAGDMPQTGQHVCGFDLLGELGRGAFSRVYLALEHRLAKRLVVLKVSSELPGEAETLSRLQHKNIVPIYSLHRHGEYYLICMPYLGGLTLADVMVPQGDGRTASITGESLVNTLAAKASRTWRDPSLHVARQSLRAISTENQIAAEPVSVAPLITPAPQMSVPIGSSDSPAAWQSVPGLSSQLVDEVSKMTTTELALWLVSQLAEGLCHAHERGVLHRDIKPANVLLSDDGMPMLLDFNLAAQARGNSTSPNVMGGTLRYMAPEQLLAIQTRAQTLSPQADVYSLGVVLYELLFQRPPYPDRTGNWNDVLVQMQQDRIHLPELVVQWRSGITPAVIEILARSLACSTHERYASAEAMRDDLMAQLEHKPLAHASNRSLRERVSKWNARHPRWSASTIVGLVAACVLAVTTIGFVLRQSRMNQLAATNWLHDLEHAQTAARSLLASADIPSSAIAQLLDDTQPVCDTDELERHQRNLDSHQVNEARRVLSHIHFYRARGAWSMFSRQREWMDQRGQWLNKSLEELSRSHELSPAPLTRLWLDTLQPLAEHWPRISSAQDSSTQHSITQDSSSQNNVSPESESLMLELLQANQRLRDSGDLVAAELKAAQQAVAAEGSNPWHWVSVGQLQLAQRQLPEARNSFSLGNQLAAATEPLPAYMLGIAELRLKNFPAALRWFDVVLDRDAGFTEALFNRAIVKTELGQLESALLDLEKMRDQMQRYPRAWFVRELVLRKLNRMAEATESRSRGLAMTPVDALGWNARGEAWLREKPPQIEKALADFDQCIALDPQYRNAYENAAHVLSERMNQPEQAIARLDAALAIDPNYALALSSRAVLHARSGHAAAARVDAAQALTIERSPIICYQAASALALLMQQADKNGDDATQEMRQADQQSAMELLKETLRKEPSLSRLMRSDSDLSELSNNGRFQEILRAAQTLQ